MANIGLGLSCQEIKVCKMNITSLEILRLLYISEIKKNAALKISEFTILGALATYYNHLEGYKIFPKQKTIAKKLEINQRTVERAIKTFKEKGLIVITKNKDNSNNYYFTNKFFNLLGKQLTDSTEKNTLSIRQNVGKVSDKMSVLNIEQIKVTNKKDSFLSFSSKKISIREKKLAKKLGRKNLTEFQLKNIDKLEKLTIAELKQFQNLEGFEKESFLIQIEKQKARKIADEKKLQELKQQKKEKSQNSKLTREEVIKHLIKQRKSIIPQVRNLKSLPDIDLMKKYNVTVFDVEQAMNLKLEFTLQ